MTYHSLTALMMSGEEVKANSDLEPSGERIILDGVKSEMQSADWSTVYEWNDINTAVGSFLFHSDQVHDLIDQQLINYIERDLTDYYLLTLNQFQLTTVIN